jgi:integrase
MPKLSDTRFTDRFLAGLQVAPGGKDRLAFDAGCRGLGVRVGTNGTRTFIAQWTDPVTRRKVRDRIGVWGTMTIEQARDAVRVRLGAVGMGTNPRAERQRQRETAERQRAELELTFEALVDEWAALHLAQRRERYRAEAVRAIKHAFPSLLRRPAARINKADVRHVLDGLVAQGKTATAGRTLSYGRSAFNWAERREMVSINPFRGLPVATATDARDRVLTDNELAEVWAATETLGYPWASFFRLSVLTLQRRAEIASMRWSELDLEKRMWQIPAARMKSGRPHDVHLSTATIVVLQAIPRIEGCDLVLTTTGRAPVSGFSKAKAALDAAIVKARAELAASTGSNPKPLAGWWAHDLRRTGVSALARLGYDSVVVDKLLAHQPTRLGAVGRVYQRHDFARERAAAFDAWAAHVTGAAVDNVIPMRKAGR